MTPVEAVTQIRALCDEADRVHFHRVEVSSKDWVRRVRAVLNAVSVDATPAQGIDREVIRKAVAPVLSDASSFPRKAQPHILGQDMRPLIKRVVDAVALVRPIEGLGGEK